MDEDISLNRDCIFRDGFKGAVYTGDSFKGAGCIFTNGTHILAGFQPRKGCINGIGGKREGDETFLQTAVREMIEELFEIYNIDELVTAIGDCVKSIDVLERGEYIIFVYTFETLTTILDLVKKSGRISPLYTEIPLTLSDLLFTRKICDSEISHLCLLPLLGDLIVEPYFLKDIRILCRQTPSS